ncbi:ribosome maturation factor RimP [Gordonia sp. HNM0687]|uniref:Ribosome maturation factor RimP n=1 Tax=Gordonia mangrovi TaxID=2665643 RepID=A0A6L7GSP6_9ACTN|nr:ribosome maturation factor RimP [Gordonia mangrovi]MXP22437.1 ribosome maturation factor RimP [Gordonia mangrovi]UVF80857.1 ribosome maturation factor RimP [Gordonia mangrovi]
MPLTADQVRRLVEPVVAAQGFDLEDVHLTHSAGRTDLSIVVDRDGGGELDVLAGLSRQLSDILDQAPETADAAYVLEVTSPGVDRPLTLPRHWRRAAGRKVTVDFADADNAAAHLRGRVGAVDDDAVEIVVNNRGRLSSTRVVLTSVTNAVVGVDFSRPSVAELELCGLDADEIARRRAAS